MPKIGKENVVSMLKDYSLDEEKIENIINFVETDGTYKEVFNANGGWTNVAVQAAFGATLSLVGEGGQNLN